MEKRRWTIIYRLFGRSRESETWPTSLPARFPWRLPSVSRTQRLPERDPGLASTAASPTPVPSGGRRGAACRGRLRRACSRPSDGAVAHQPPRNRSATNIASHGIKQMHAASSKTSHTLNKQFDVRVSSQGIWSLGPPRAHCVGWEKETAWLPAPLNTCPPCPTWNVGAARWSQGPR